MNDKELLELAAKAAGYVYRPNEHGCFINDGSGFDYWNPFTDDGDALRLAVKLQFKISIQHEYATNGTAIYFNEDDEENKAWEDHCNDPYAATRRAIVRAAAEIGRSSPEKPDK